MTHAGQDPVYAGALLGYTKASVRNTAAAITETATPQVRRMLMTHLRRAIRLHGKSVSLYVQARVVSCPSPRPGHPKRLPQRRDGPGDAGDDRPPHHEVQTHVDACPPAAGRSVENRAEHVDRRDTRMAYARKIAVRIRLVHAALAPGDGVAPQ